MIKTNKANTIVTVKLPVTFVPPKNGTCPHKLRPSMKKNILNNKGKNCSYLFKHDELESNMSIIKKLTFIAVQ